MKKVNIDDIDVLQEQMQDLWVRCLVFIPYCLVFAPVLGGYCSTANLSVNSQCEVLQCMQYDHEEIQDMLGRSFAVGDDIDEDELLGELDLIEDEMALEADMGTPTGVPAFLEEPDLPAAPTGTVQEPATATPERPMQL